MSKDDCVAVLTILCVLFLIYSDPVFMGYAGATYIILDKLVDLFDRSEDKK